MRKFIDKAFERAGYEEVELGLNIPRALWRYAAKHDWESVQAVLVYDMGHDWLEEDAIADFVVVSMPDDMAGESYRAWVKVR